MADLSPSGPYAPILRVLRGFRNGAYYGAKIRFPHALVMTFLFRPGNLRSKVEAILRATYTHARNLGVFVFIFKSLLEIQKRLCKGVEHSYHHFVAGCIGGYLVFGDFNSINTQIVLYLFSRVSLAMAKVAVDRNLVESKKYGFPLFAAAVWGLVMWLFEAERRSLQNSLQSSMAFIYEDSKKWSHWRDFLL